MEKILIVEDDLAISDLIKLNLNIVGYETEQVYDGQDALGLIKEEKFDLIILDIMLPGLDGFTLMEKVKSYSIPVIFLTAKDTLSNKIKGLKMGAEDYIVKPFEAMELLARIEVVLRRYGKKNDTLYFKNIKILIEERLVKNNEEIVDLTIKEFELLKILIENKGIALTRDRLLEKVWGYDYLGETRTIDMHIQKLRKKLNLIDEIKTVYKIGYRLED